jgi:hypothetical protein
VSEHFTASQWVDLVRGQLPQEVANEMDRHLRMGCSECVDAFDTWQGLAVFASEERASMPVDHPVRIAQSYAQRKLAGPTLASNPAATWASAALATLIFDSEEPAAPGVRATAATFSRHLVFGANSLIVDVHIDTASRAGWFLLQGQVADRNQPNRPLENIWLSLIDGRQEITTFRTNEVGEFLCTFDVRQALKLIVYAGRHVVAIPIET